MEEAMTTVQIAMDFHTLDRLEALTLLQKEHLPGLPYEQGDAARQALAWGLDLMLGELLLGSGRKSGRRRRATPKAYEVA